jgi:undecaprenyl-diphosphatase
MSFFQALILGIVQGLTEFLPISSSAHLVLVPYLLNWSFPAEQIFPFDVLVQWGTLIAVILYFWKDLVSILKAFFKGLIEKKPFKDPEARLGWYLILATIPAGIAGVLIKSQVEAAFSSPRVTALFLLLTAALLVLADQVGKRTRQMEEMTWLDALWIGVFQAISIFPGVSRSGSTIAGGMTRQFDRSSSARFSFLMSIPVMLGAGIVSTKDLLRVPNLSSFLPVLLIGFITAAIVGYLSIHWLLQFIKRQKFWGFAVYCALLAMGVLLFGALHPAVASAQTTPAATAAVSLPTDSQNTQPVVLQVQMSSSLYWLAPTASSCAANLADFPIVFDTVDSASVPTAADTVQLRWGAPASLPQPAYQLGSETLVVAVNSANPLQSLNKTTLQKIFSGQITSWSELQKACPDCFSAALPDSLSAQNISFGVYPSEQDVEAFFRQALLDGRPDPAGAGLLVPNVEMMRDTLSTNVATIGPLPEHAITEGIKALSITDADPAALTAPVLAIAPGTLSASTQIWLKCIEKGLNP